ncbi:MAG: hypothetical protein P8N49_06520 [Opitutales bacterium]|nr:hypothetical protein [Opitutales bacterium]
MVLDFEDDDESGDSMVKWPFFASAIFIVSLVGVFAFLHYQQEGFLGNWQLVGCMFGSALASILIFFPFFAEKALFLAFDARKPSEEEFNRKVFFDLKEMKEELDTLAVKIDKVPSVVDQILSKSKEESQEKDDKIQSILENVKQAEDNLTQKIISLEQLVSSPLPQDPDPKIEEVQAGVQKNHDLINKFSKSFKDVEKSILALKQQIKEISPPFQTPYPIEPPPSDDMAEASQTPSISEAIEKEFQSEASLPELQDSEPEEENKTESIPDATPFAEEEEKIETEKTAEIEPLPSPPLEVESESIEEVDTHEDKNSAGEEDRELDPVEPEITQEAPVALAGTAPVETPEHDIAASDNELKLDLPDPEETIRKVDALLAGEKLPVKTKADPLSKDQPDKNAVTAVIANVMIGIGNKPFLRGDGPGLNWDEGVPMNFVEIGKWAWSPSRKNATFTVQVFRNDEDPDKGGKYEIKPGDKFEITPDF